MRTPTPAKASQWMEPAALDVAHRVERAGPAGDLLLEQQQDVEDGVEVVADSDAFRQPPAVVAMLAMQRSMHL